MALGFSFGGEGGNIIPIVKFDSRSGRMSRIDRQNGVEQVVDLTRTFKAVMDLENIEVGHISFAANMAPDFRVVRFGQPVPSAPSENHKSGFRLLLKLHKDSGGDVRELASTAKACLRGVDALHTAYLAGRDANPGKLPVVSLGEPVAITTGEGAKKSTNWSPTFQIIGWVDRPADLIWTPKAAAPAQTAPAAVQAASDSWGVPSTGSTPLAAPVAPAAALDPNDFG